MVNFCCVSIMIFFPQSIFPLLLYLSKHSTESKKYLLSSVRWNWKILFKQGQTLFLWTVHQKAQVTPSVESTRASMVWVICVFGVKKYDAEFDHLTFLGNFNEQNCTKNIKISQENLPGTKRIFRCFFIEWEKTSFKETMH